MPSNNTPSQHHYNKSLHRREFDVFSPDGLICYSVPAGRIVHFGDEGKRMMVCRNYASGGTCPMGNHCKFVHIDVPLNNLRGEAIHTHYVWRDPSVVSYECLAPSMAKMRPILSDKVAADTVLSIFGPNNRAPVEDVRAGDLLLTVGGERAFAIAMGEREIDTTKSSPHPCHCAHYYFNQVCNRGAGCGFVHVISLNPKQAEAKVRHSNFHKRLEAMGAEAKYPLYSNPHDQYTAGYYRWQDGHHPAPAYGSNPHNAANTGDQQHHINQPSNYHNIPSYTAASTDAGSFTGPLRPQAQEDSLPPPPPAIANTQSNPLPPSDAFGSALSVTIGSGPSATSLLPPSMDEPYQSRVPPPPPLGASNNGSRATSPRFQAHGNNQTPNATTVDGSSIIKEATQHILISTPSPQWHQSPGQSANQLMLSPSSDPCSVGAEIPNDPIDNVPTPTRNYANAKANTPNAARHRQIPSSAQSPPMPPASALQNNNLSKSPQSGQYAWPPQPRNSPPPLLRDSGIYQNNNQPSNNRGNLEGYHQQSSGIYEDDVEEDMDAKYHRRFASEENHKIHSVKDSENGLAASGREGSFRGLGASGYNNNGLDRSLNGTTNLNNTVSSSCGGGARYSYNPYSTNQVLRTHPSSLCSSAVATPATRSPAIRPIFGMEGSGVEAGMFPKMSLPQAEGHLDGVPPPPQSSSPNRSSVRV